MGVMFLAAAAFSRANASTAVRMRPASRDAMMTFIFVCVTRLCLSYLCARLHTFDVCLLCSAQASTRCGVLIPAAGNVQRKCCTCRGSGRGAAFIRAGHLSSTHRCAARRERFDHFQPNAAVAAWV